MTVTTSSVTIITKTKLKLNELRNILCTILHNLQAK
jgi:hypothetical protein